MKLNITIDGVHINLAPDALDDQNSLTRDASVPATGNVINDLPGKDRTMRRQSRKHPVRVLVDPIYRFR